MARIEGRSGIRRRRLRITLAEAAVRLLDRLAAKGDRSRFIEKAVRAFAAERARRRIKARLKEGAIRRAARDLRLAEEP